MPHTNESDKLVCLPLHLVYLNCSPDIKLEAVPCSPSGVVYLYCCSAFMLAQYIHDVCLDTVYSAAFHYVILK